MGRLQCLCVLCSTVSARARALRARALLQKGEAAAALHLCVQQGCITHPLPLSYNITNMVQSLQGSVQWLLLPCCCQQLLGNYSLDNFCLFMTPITQTMAISQPRLWTREGLEPLGSDLEG